MMGTPLSALIGKQIFQLGTEEIFTDQGYERIIVRALGSPDIEFRCLEIEGTQREGYCEEFYTLEVVLGNENSENCSFSDCDFTVHEIEILTAEEWTVAVERSPDTVGINPRMLHSGAIGSAPAGSDSVIVNAGVIMRDASNSRQILIATADYPGLVRLCVEPTEIDALRKAYTIIAPDPYDERTTVSSDSRKSL